MKSCTPNPDGGQVWDATYFKLLEETIFVDASKFSSVLIGEPSGGGGVFVNVMVETKGHT